MYNQFNSYCEVEVHEKRLGCNIGYKPQMSALLSELLFHEEVPCTVSDDAGSFAFLAKNLRKNTSVKTLKV